MLQYLDRSLWLLRVWEASSWWLRQRVQTKSPQPPQSERYGLHFRKELGTSGGSTYPPALALYPEDKPGPSAFLKLTDKAVALIFGLPEAFGIAQDKAEYLRNYLNRYPTAGGWESSAAQSVPAFRDPVAGWATRLQWRLPKASDSAAERSDYLLTTVAPRYDTFSCGWIRPALGPQRDSPSALMT